MYIYLYLKKIKLVSFTSTKSTPNNKIIKKLYFLLFVKLNLFVTSLYQEMLRFLDSMHG